MSSLVVVTNRGPVAARVADDGTLQIEHAGGGLAPSLARALGETDALWIACAMTEAERQAAREGAISHGALEVRLVELPAEVLSGAYNGIANATLWFVYHGMFDRVNRPTFDRRWYAAWDAYRTYNHAFAEEIAKRADHQATVVVNDYHLALVGSYLARERPDLSTVHFSHTPFSLPDELSVLPQGVAKELLNGMCDFGACGFHTARWAEAFAVSARTIVDRDPYCFVAPLGPDPNELSEVASSDRVARCRDELLGRLNGRKLIVRSDRIEPSKNIVRGFLGFEALIEREPEHGNDACFVAHGYPSRTELPEYLAYRSEVERVVARINDRFDSDTPLVELHLDDDYEASIAALSCYDALLVNPIRDGMNLVAKEGPLINANAGVLLLSRPAGAFDELGSAAIEVHPYDVVNTASGLSTALLMPRSEREKRAAELRERSAACPPGRWLELVVAEARVVVRGPRDSE